MHEIVKWVLIALMALSAIGNILLIGEPREPITPKFAALSVVLNAALIAMILAWL